MTGFLNKRSAGPSRSLRSKQDAVASQIIENIEDGEAWTRRFRDNPGVLRSLAGGS